jgi:malate-CoA ligase subunit beta
MDIHEYQAKELLARHGVHVPRGGLAYSPEQATYRAREIGGSKWVLKAQVHSGARGKAGGIKLCSNDEEISSAAARQADLAALPGGSGRHRAGALSRLRA